MTKKQIKSAINKAAYQYAKSLGYQISDDNDGAYVTFMKPGTVDGDDSIDWSRSHHQTIVLNWASDQIKSDAQAIDNYMRPIIEQYN